MSDPSRRRQQQVADFLDEDEAAEAARAAPRIAAGFDTFGAAAAAEARGAAAAEAAARSELLPELLPAELLAPVRRSVGACRSLRPPERTSQGRSGDHHV